MLVKMIKGATRIVGKSQGYLGLPIKDEMVFCPVNKKNVPTMITAWEPTPTELEALNNGGSIYVSIYGTVPPPMLIWAADTTEGNDK